MSLSAIYRQLKKDLNNIETELEAAVTAKHPILQQASLQLLKAGGKRIRPVFVLLSSEFGDRQRSLVNNVAVTLELIHMASLVHDDVVDNADLRRGKETVKAQWDNRVAMYTGDFIFAQALDLMSEFENVKAHEVLSKAIKEMSLGEIVQSQNQGDWQQNLRQYLLRIKRKTAILMAVSCQLGAMAAGASASIHKKLYYFGYFTGMSFQITDDILDFVGTEAQLGKPAGSDIKQGNLTLPALYAYQWGENQNELQQLVTMTNKSKDEWDQIIKVIKQSGGIDYAQGLSDRYLQKAYDVLHTLPDEPAKSSLRKIADYIGKRKY
ncbi:heptaprenyl diphosphate synthase component II [Tuberibacillus sp. Marseille-P3662]|uniref:heptaprenyl diphosphate synthase component II n=1 Tax=Tuberibacillus sp. Marseille-P3662 TaxID=1965358 RepID=UPI000A1CAA8F|nr:heptaprenyl diphosphate synthase component II [Tuberibacillus sp. Marseille-P3662]